MFILAASSSNRTEIIWNRTAFTFSSSSTARVKPVVSTLLRYSTISPTVPCTVEIGITVFPIVTAEFVLEQPVTKRSNPAPSTATIFLTLFTKSPFTYLQFLS